MRNTCKVSRVAEEACTEAVGFTVILMVLAAFALAAGIVLILAFSYVPNPNVYPQRTGTMITTLPEPQKYHL
jgi:hypothetical protein